MKVIKQNNNFTPVTLTITLESAREVAAMFALFNFKPIIEIVSARGIECQEITSYLEGSTDGPIRYDEVHTELCSKLRG
jgi:hypothetical protein